MVDNVFQRLLCHCLWLVVEVVVEVDELEEPSSPFDPIVGMPGIITVVEAVLEETTPLSLLPPVVGIPGVVPLASEFEPDVVGIPDVVPLASEFEPDVVGRPEVIEELLESEFEPLVSGRVRITSELLVPVTTCAETEPAKPITAASATENNVVYTVYLFIILP